ncbi:MAG: ABC transporter substrate-binding protein, partial [Planctomycetota bacterium]
VLLSLVALTGTGCDGGTSPEPGRPRNTGIASTSPAATDLLRYLRRVADEHGHTDDWPPLVGVSDFDVTDDQPKVGGYLNFDWETLAQLRPATLIVQVSPDKLPAEDKARAADLNIALLHLQIDRLPDIIDAVRTLATEAGVIDTDSYADHFEQQLAASEQSAPASGPVPTLIVLSSDLTFLAGRGNYLDDLLVTRGGVNALGDQYSAWPSVDDEVLRSLRPEAVVLVMPAATEADLATARQRFDQVADDWPVSWEQVAVLDAPYAMTPGASVIEVGQAIANTIRAAHP